MIVFSRKHIVFIVLIVFGSTSFLYGADEEPTPPELLYTEPPPPAPTETESPVSSAKTSKKGASSAKVNTPAPKASNVLDFDADIIEGERSGPSIMVQMDLQAPNLDTLVFQRKNFNDFHSVDMKRKPKYRGQ